MAPSDRFRGRWCLPSMASKPLSSLRTIATFLKEGGCSNTLFCTLDRAYDHPMRNEERASLPFAGGIMQHGYQCGMLWGATLAAGGQAYRACGPGPAAEAKAIVAAARLVDAFRARTHETNCLEITDTDKSSSTAKLFTHFVLKGGTLRCFRMAAGYARTAYAEIDEAMAETPAEVPATPVSCAALLARKLGASDMHATMAAGLAGGIGLCGEACGALGAALWLKSLRRLEGKAGKVDFKYAEGLALIDRLLKHTGYELVCAKLVGRKFTSPADHAAYLHAGGCAKLLDALAAT